MDIDFTNIIVNLDTEKMRVIVNGSVIELPIILDKETLIFAIQELLFDRK